MVSRGITGIWAACLALSAVGDVVLMGRDIPNPSVRDGDFEEVKAGWRSPGPSPYWTAAAEGAGWGKAGFALGKMMNTGRARAVFESVVLEAPGFQSLEKGSELHWRFAAGTEYPCNGRVTLALVFGGQERVVADRLKVPNGPEPPKTYEGRYTVTGRDRGMPRLKFTLESTHGIKVFVDWVDLKLVEDEPIQLTGSAAEDGIQLRWNREAGPAAVYRSDSERSGFLKMVGNVEDGRLSDLSVVSGRTYYYAVRVGDRVSNVSRVRKTDTVPPAAPFGLQAEGGDWVVKLRWKTRDSDVAYFQIFRDGVCIAPHVEQTSFEDLLPVKGVENRYAVAAVDFSGNEGPRSGTASAKVKLVRGASFSDLILPMPVHGGLRGDVWGAETVRPRNPDNGIEDAEWSYWGGKAVFENGKYHLNVVRWPESAREGHWAWPNSTVAYAVADAPTGPYRVVRDRAYDFREGHGHNANIMLLNDGSYAMYSLIDWKPTILVSDSMAGPWRVLGEIQVNVPENYRNAYRLERNLSGLQCEDGSFLVVTKAGAVIRSTQGILGPYDVVSGTTDENETIPLFYRRSNYEDPVMWYDGVQYHKIINAFLDYRAIYLRSPDGIHWKYEQGLAYTPACTVYEDGTRTLWYKVERPNVIQDEFGRATHLELAAIDVPKREDFGGDRHSSKHLILPLVVPKRLSMLNTKPVDAQTEEIRLLIRSEPGFDAARDLDLESLRFGGSEAVNTGGGSRVWKTQPHPDGLVLIFRGGNGLTEQNFVGKLIGQKTNGGLVVGYSKLVAELEQK